MFIIIINDQYDGVIRSLLRYSWYIYARPLYDCLGYLAQLSAHVQKRYNNNISNTVNEYEQQLLTVKI